MNTLGLLLPGTIFIGLGATLVLDLWGLLLEHAFNVAHSGACLVGRWLLNMPEGVLRHSSLASGATEAWGVRVRMDCAL